MGTVVLALCAAALWGTGDFFGGLAARRASVLTVLFWSQLAGLAGLVVWTAASGSARPGAGSLFAAGAGVAGVVGLGCLYRGLAVGAMGIVAPISATSPIVPLVVDLARGRSPAPVQWVGIVFAIAGIVLVSRDPGGGHGAGGGRCRPCAHCGPRVRAVHRRARRGGTGKRPLGHRHGTLQLAGDSPPRPRLDALGAAGVAAAVTADRVRRGIRRGRATCSSRSPRPEARSASSPFSARSIRSRRSCWPARSCTSDSARPARRAGSSRSGEPP